MRTPEDTMSTADTAAATRHPGPQPDVRRVPQWRNLQFQTLWIGATTSTLGVSVADIAYPLTILAITRSPAMAGLFAAVQALGMLLAGLPAGVLADRYDSRTIVICAEAARAVVTGAVAVALIMGYRSLPVLFAAAALLGIGQAVKGSAQMLLLRSVVPAEQLTQALAQDEVRMNGAALAGPALGGALYAVRALAHAIPFLFTAGSFAAALISAILGSSCRGRRKTRETGRRGSPGTHRRPRPGTCSRACIRSGTSPCSVRPRCSSCA